MKRIIVWFCVLVVALVAQTQNNDKVDVKTFLENIKKMFQETVEKMRKQQQNRMKRREDKKNKVRTRKMLINKLATPYVLRPQHTIIDYKKEPNTRSNSSDLKEKNNKLDGKTGGISTQTIDKVLKVNPVFNPFRIDQLKKLLRRIQKPPGNFPNDAQNSSTSSSGTTEPDPQTLRYMGELYNWLEEVYSKIEWFWDMVYMLFIVDEGRFKYLEEVLCRGEIETPTYDTPALCAKLPARFKVINLRDPYRMPCQIQLLNVDKLEVDSNDLGKIMACKEYWYISNAIYNTKQCTPLLYKNAILKGSEHQSKTLKAVGISPQYDAKQSLCYNLAALNFFAYKNELYYVLSYNIKERDKINYISSKAKRFISYIQFMEKIFKDKIIPAMVDMCYIKCLCEDAGIRCGQDRGMEEEEKREDTLIFLLYNLSPIYKIVIEQWGRYTESYQELTTCKENTKTIKEVLDGINDELTRLIEKYSRENYRKIDMNLIKEIIGSVKRDQIAEAFKAIYDSAPKLLIYILKSKLLDRVAEKFKEVEKSVIKGIEKNDKCFLKFAENMAKAEIFRGNKTYTPYLSYLASKNIDAFVVTLDSYYTTLLRTGSGVTVDHALSYFKILNYRIYSLISSYKRKKCYYQMQDKDLESLKIELESYRCIFDDSNRDMNIGCYDKIFSGVNEIQRKLFTNLFNGLGINMHNLSEKVSEIGKHGMNSYRDKVEFIGNTVKLCNAINKIAMKLLEVISEDFTKIGFAQQATSVVCTPANTSCNNRRCLEAIKEMCKDPIPTCPSSTAGAQCRNPGRICIENDIPRLKGHCSFSYGNLFDNAKISSILRSSLGSVYDEGEKKNKYYDDACAKLAQGYNTLCNVIDSEEGSSYEEKTGNAIKKAVLLCGWIKAQKIDTDINMNKIKDEVGKEYLKMLNENSSPAKLKELYKKYQNGIICND